MLSFEGDQDIGFQLGKLLLITYHMQRWKYVAKTFDRIILNEKSSPEVENRIIKKETRIT